MCMSLCVCSQLCDELNKKAGDDTAKRKTNGKTDIFWCIYGL